MRALCGRHQFQGANGDFSSLREEFGRSVVLVQCHVSRSHRPTATYTLSEKREESHRPRSFLFLTTAVGVATLAGVNEIYIPENGLIALNAPLGVSRSGTLSTRTVPPRFLVDFVNLVNELGIYEGTLANPYLLKSKTDMLKGVSKDLHSLKPNQNFSIVPTRSCCWRSCFQS